MVTASGREKVPSGGGKSSESAGVKHLTNELLIARSKDQITAAARSYSVLGLERDQE